MRRSNCLLCLFPLAAILVAEPIPRTLQPVAVTAGGPAFTLAVSGTGFAPSSRITWDGSTLPTRFESETLLAADIPAYRIARAGNAAVAVTRSDQQLTAALTLTVNPPLEWITSSILPSAPMTLFYSQALGVSGGTVPVRFALISGTLPAGLHFDGYNGAVVGYASSVGEYQLSVRATDASGASAQQSFRLNVAGELRIVSGPSLPAAIVGQAYATQLVADGGVAPMAEWKVTAGSLPRGLVLDEKTGRIAGATTAPSGVSQFTMRVRDAAGKTATSPMSLEVRAGLSITPRPPLAELAEGDPVDLTMSATGGVPTYVWALDSGDLPPGLALDSSTGVLRGTAEKAGNYRAVLRVRDSSGTETRATVEFQIAPRLSLIAPPSTNAVVGTAVAIAVTASGGAAPYSYGIAAGSLPAGFRFDAGRLEGIPRAEGEVALTVEVRDRAQRTARADIRFRVTPPPLPELQLAPLSHLLPTQQTRLDLRLNRAYPTDLDLTVQLAFDGPDDPAILLSTGGRQARLTIPAGQLVPTQPLQLQTGTTAGTVTIAAHLASQSAMQSAALDPLPPQVRSVQWQKTADGFEVVISAFSPTRELDAAVFAFDENLRIKVPIRDLAGAWYSDERSTPFGTLITYRQRFIVQGDTSRLRGVSVTLTNRIGTSIPASVAF